MTSRGMNSGDKAAGSTYTKICTDNLCVLTTELDLNEGDTISYIYAKNLKWKGYKAHVITFEDINTE